MAERLQKYLAGLGLGSRREIEGWIREKRVRVDGELAELGMKVSGNERILVDSKPVRKPKRESKHRTIIYHKPAGEICTRSDPQERRTIFQSLPRVLNKRWITVGRLDFQTTGLLLLTTDGELANRLMHPSAELEREYIVRVFGEISDDDIKQLLSGVLLDDGPAKFNAIGLTDDDKANKSFHVTVSEGRNRIIRRLFEAVGARVSRLIRIRYGTVKLPRSLKPGKFRDLEPGEMATLLEALK